MTAHERALAEIREEACACAAVPEIEYEAGVTIVRCPRCKIASVTPDFEPEQILAAWRGKIDNL